MLEGRRKYRVIHVEPTANCNLSCTVCPWTALHTGRSDMEWKTYEAVSGYFHEAEEVDLTGRGEPLLNSRLEEMIQSAKASGCTAGLKTNATLLSPRRADSLLQASPDWIGFSAVGATPETYEKVRRGASFKKMLANLERVRSLKGRGGNGNFRTILFFRMLKENLHELPAMIDLAHSLEIDEFVARNLDPKGADAGERKKILPQGHGGGNRESFHRLVEEAKRKAERAKLSLNVEELSPAENPMCEQNPLETFFVAWDGTVSPCIHLSQVQRGFVEGKWQTIPPLRWGNIVEEPLQNIWGRAEYVHFRNLFRERLNVYLKKLREFAASGFEGFQGVGGWPPLPEPCRVCYGA